MSSPNRKENSTKLEQDPSSPRFKTDWSSRLVDGALAAIDVAVDVAQDVAPVPGLASVATIVSQIIKACANVKLHK